MGIYDRDYVREEPRGLQLGGDWSAVAMIIALNLAVYFLDLLSNNDTLRILALRSDVFEHPAYLWQLLTYGWLHDQRSLVHLLFNMITLWFFGRDVETDLYTKSRFWRFYLSGMIVSGLAWAIAQQPWFPHGANALPDGKAPPLIGASGAIMAVVAFFICRFPKRTVLLFGVVPVPAWLLGVFYLISDLSGAMGKKGDNVAYSAHLAGAAMGFLYFKTGWSLLDVIPWNRFGKVTGTFKKNPSVKIHRPSVERDELDDDDDDLSTRVDELLAKIHEHGEKSLTPAERRFLENASRKLRERQRK